MFIRRATRIITALIAVMFAVLSPALAADALPRITSATASTGSLTVAWTYDGKADAFTLQYSCDGGVAWETIDMIPADQRAFTFETGALAENCVVRMAAKVDNVNTAFTDIASPMLAPSVAPTNVQLDDKTRTISWGNAGADGVVEYEVQSSADDGVSWDILGKVDGALSGLQLATVMPGDAYRVVAITDDGQRVASEIFRALDEAAADVVRTASISDRTLLAIGITALVLAFIVGRWQLANRRKSRLTAGFEDFDALTRR